MSRFLSARFGVRNTALFLSMFLLSGFMTVALSQSPTPGAKSTKDLIEQLIPVTNPLVVEKCSRCHLADAKGNLSRISSVRTTPQGSEHPSTRMARPNAFPVPPPHPRQTPP